METPILDFVRNYSSGDMSRLHMPGHKGKAFLGCEPLDITEIKGADALYEADGIISRSEANAAKLFGSGKTLFSTEGSSQCIRAMLYLAVMNRKSGGRAKVVAARNVHKAFVYSAALIDFDPVWLWSEDEDSDLCACKISAESLDKLLSDMCEPPAAVYITSPNYLGELADIKAIADVCHAHGTLLFVDNAHGAYLHFLEKPCHPLDLGADMCCDSAHKTLPVLTGGAYLHIAKNMPECYYSQAKAAMALFGSTSPSYLTMASLDGCNAYLADNYTARLSETISELNSVKNVLKSKGWNVMKTEPLKLTIRAENGTALAEKLRENKIECEFSDGDNLVCMITPENPRRDFERLVTALGEATKGERVRPKTMGQSPLRQVCSPRQALFAVQETIPVREALGRICGTPTVSCPPAIPIAVSGEEIDENAVKLFERYGIETVAVVKSL